MSITSINQIAKLMAWLQQHGCIMERLNRKAIEKKLLDPELVPAVRRVLELRLGGAQAAVKKIDALLARASDDGRVRGAFRYHGAGTGRTCTTRSLPRCRKASAARMSSPIS